MQPPALRGIFGHPKRGAAAREDRQRPGRFRAFRARARGPQAATSGTIKAVQLPQVRAREGPTSQLSKLPTIQPIMG